MIIHVAHCGGLKGTAHIRHLHVLKYEMNE